MAGRVIFYWFRPVYLVVAVQTLSQNQMPVIVVEIIEANLTGDHNVRKS